tara:strand:+ start:200 stop:1399 length:1200 start_codon:yes stop_codon:yes gene_type:complete
MAISVGAVRRASAQNKAMRNLADKIEEEKRKEGKLGGLLGALSPLAAKASTWLIGGLGGPLLAPLLKGVTTSLLKKWTEEGLRSSGMGMKESNIKSDSKYGYGVQAAEDTRKMLREGRKDRGWSPESLGVDVGLSYLSALTPEVSFDEKGNPIIKGGEMSRDLKDPSKVKKGWLQRASKGDFSLMGKDPVDPVKLKAPAQPVVPPPDVPEYYPTDDFSPDLTGGYDPAKVHDSVYSKTGVTDVLPDPIIGQSDEVPSISDAFTATTDAVDDRVSPIFTGNESSSFAYPTEKQPVPLQNRKDVSLLERWQGIRSKFPGAGGTYGIPEGETQKSWAKSYLKALKGDKELYKILKRDQPDYLEKFKFEEGGQVPTVAEYLDMQGKTLGGNNKKSLAEMLGRK